MHINFRKNKMTVLRHSTRLLNAISLQKVGAKNYVSTWTSLRRPRLWLASSALLAAGAGLYCYQDVPTRRKVRVTIQGVTSYVRSVIYYDTKLYIDFLALWLILVRETFF